MIFSTMRTIIIVLLDESGSMESTKVETIDSFNDFIFKQKELKTDQAVLYFIKFNEETSVVYENEPIESVAQLTAETYIPNGMTALYDAIVKSVHIVDKNIEPEDRVVCVIITDGEENSSKEANLDSVKKIITYKESEKNWSFVYIGQQPEKWSKETGSSLGNTLAYNHERPHNNLLAANDAITTLRSSQMLNSQNLINPSN
jgi:Mg-chelatase subunit ChlD